MARLSSIILCIALFAAIGPALGTFATLVYFGATSGAPLRISEWLAPDMWSIYGLTIIVGYLLGVLPAALSGLIFGLVLAIRKMSYFLSALAGAAIGALTLIAALSITAKSFPGSTSLQLPLFLGSFSGLLCAVTSNFIVIRTGANNSFKPKPLRGSA
jgi:hypothetical protein